MRFGKTKSQPLEYVYDMRYAQYVTLPFSKNYDTTKKPSKTLDIRLKETKSKSSKSLKNNLVKKINFADPPKRI